MSLHELHGLISEKMMAIKYVVAFGIGDNCFHIYLERESKASRKAIENLVCQEAHGVSWHVSVSGKIRPAGA